MLNKDAQDKDILYSLLLVLSGILTDKDGNAKCKFLFVWLMKNIALHLTFIEYLLDYGLCFTYQKKKKIMVCVLLWLLTQF